MGLQARFCRLAAATDTVEGAIFLLAVAVQVHGLPVDDVHVVDRDTVYLIVFPQIIIVARVLPADAALVRALDAVLCGKMTGELLYAGEPGAADARGVDGVVFPNVDFQTLGRVQFLAADLTGEDRGRRRRNF